MKGFSRLVNTDFYLQEFTSVDESYLYQDDVKLIDFGSSSYLELERDITLEDLEKAKSFGLRNNWSRISGNTSITRNLEADLEKSLNIDSVRLAQSISLINLTIFHSLGRYFDHILMDEDAHVTLKLGACGKNQSKLRYFINRNVKHLESFLSTLDAKERKLIVVDGVYSMNGTLAPIEDLIQLCKRYNSMLLIDDAHGFGVIGQNGKGVIDQLTKDQMDRIFYTGSFSKCASNPVAFIGAPKEFTDIIDKFTPCLIYSGPPSNFHVAIAHRHFKEFSRQRYIDIRSNLNRSSLRIHKFLDDNKIQYFSLPGLPIVSVKINEINLEEIIAGLRESNIFAKAAIYPVVRKGNEVIRFTITNAHKDEHLDKLKEALFKIKHLLGST